MGWRMCGEESRCGFKKRLQIVKNRMVALTSTAVSELLDAFGNLTRKKHRNPNSATRSKHNQTSSAALIHIEDARRHLKKSQRIYEEFMKTPAKITPPERDRKPRHFH